VNELEDGEPQERTNEARALSSCRRWSECRVQFPDGNSTIIVWEGWRRSATTRW